MPLTNFQRKVLRIVSENRSPDSYVAGGSALNAVGGRFSQDIDIFSDSAERSAVAAQADALSLSQEGFEIDWILQSGGFSRAVVSDQSGSTKLEWADDSAFRYFPTQEDPNFGYTLHPVDAACNKMMAAVSRSEIRDAVDLVRIERDILPLGPLAWAAAEKSPGFSPNAMIDRIRQQASHRPEDIDQISMTDEISAPALNLWLRRACDRAETWLESVPRGTDSGLIIDKKTGGAIDPDFSRLKPTSWTVHKGKLEGVWPTSSEISSAMLRRDDER